MKPIVILGIFVADTAYRADRQPKMGETILGTSFVLGPGGKGSNQSVAAAMAGGKVHFITRLGADAFADIAHATWSKAGVVPEVKVDSESYTGRPTSSSRTPPATMRSSSRPARLAGSLPRMSRPRPT